MVRPKNVLWQLAYMVLAVPMFYFIAQDITIGGFGFMYRYLFGMGIIALAVLAFLIRPDFKRGVLSVKYSAVLLTPYLWTLIYSLVLWALTLSAFRVITRGLFYIVYLVIAVLAAASAVYLFGKKGLYLQLLALFIADGIYILQSIAANGLGTFVSEYIQLVVTFTGNTGPVMKSFEILGHSYPLGLFLVYFFINFKENKRDLLWALAAGALFVLGLKRSVLGAMVVAILVGWVLNKMKDPKRWLQLLAVLFMVFGVVYVYAVSLGAFDYLESIGLDTNGRDWLFGEFRPYYDMGIGYFGKGAGFVAGSIANGDIALVTKGGYAYGDIHNDFLRQYIELGFVGFIVWMVFFLGPRLSYFFHTGQTAAEKRHGVMSAAVILVTFVTFMTENSLYHYYNTLFLAAVIMAYRYDEFAGKIRLPGESQ